MAASTDGSLLTRNTYKVHGGAFQPAAHLGWVELVLAPRYWKGCHGGGLQKQKSGENNECTQPVSATKIGQDNKTEAASSAADVFPHLRQKGFVWQGFLHIPVLLLNSGWRFITAQQFGWWLKGGEGKPRIRERGGEAVGPALPALGPALASNCNSSSGGKVSSAWLPPTSPQFLHLWPLPLSRNLLWAQSSPILPLIPDLNWKTKKGIYQGAIRSLCLCFCALSVVFSAFTPPMTVRQAARGKYVSSPSFKISPPSLVNSGGADSHTD